MGFGCWFEKKETGYGVGDGYEMHGWERREVDGACVFQPYPISVRLVVMCSENRASCHPSSGRDLVVPSSIMARVDV